MKELISSFIEAWTSVTSFRIEGGKEGEISIDLNYDDNTDILYSLASGLINMVEVDSFYPVHIKDLVSGPDHFVSITVSGHYFTTISGYSNILKAPTYHSIIMDVEKGYGQIVMDL